MSTCEEGPPLHHERTPLEKFKSSAHQAAHLGGLAEGFGSQDSILERNQQDQEHERFKDALSRAPTFHDKLQVAKKHAGQGFHRADGEHQKHGKALRVKKRVEDQQSVSLLPLFVFLDDALIPFAAHGFSVGLKFWIQITVVSVLCLNKNRVLIQFYWQ